MFKIVTVLFLFAFKCSIRNARRKLENKNRFIGMQIPYNTECEQYETKTGQNEKYHGFL